MEYIIKPTDSTKEIQLAIDEVHKNGGGIVKVPAGEYIIGTIELKSNITLYLENGAILKGSDNIEDFKDIGYYHTELKKTTSVIFAKNSENIHIDGNGVIDLNGNIQYNQNEYNLIGRFIDKMTEEQKKEAPWKFSRRVTQPIFFLNCKDITIKDITVTNGSCWTIVFVENINVKLRGVTIKNHPNVPNNDGMHFCSCKDVIISDCNIDAADDCIAISAITDWEKSSENFVITNCILRSRSKALSVGYMRSIVKNVMISNCTVLESSRAFSIMSSKGDGYVENICVTNCHFDTRIYGGDWWGNGEPIYIMGTFHNRYTEEKDRNWRVNVKNIYFTNITCTAENAIAIVGDGHNIENVNFTNITYTMKESKNIGIKGRVIDLAPSKQIPTLPETGDKYYFCGIDCKDVKIENMTIHGDLVNYQRNVI
ncbi:MAG: glycoside hydrolase family 28 protein [Lachnospirales bacterium]